MLPAANMLSASVLLLPYIIVYTMQPLLVDEGILCFTLECVHSCSSVGGDKYDQFCTLLCTLHILWLHLLTVYKRYVFKPPKVCKSEQ